MRNIPMQDIKITKLEGNKPLGRLKHRREFKLECIFVS
jgi:hypothetical protein